MRSSSMPDVGGAMAQQRRRWWQVGGYSRRSSAAIVAAGVFLVLMGLPLAVLVWPAPGPASSTSPTTASSTSPTTASTSGSQGRLWGRGLQVVNLASLFFWNLKQTAKEIIKEQAAVARIDPDRVNEAFATLEPVEEALGITSDVRSFNAAWDGFWLRRAGTCLADSVERLIEGVSSTKCAVVLLIPGRRYHLEDQILVTTNTAIIGSPAERAIIDASDAQRAFILSRGVSLELRHLLLYEGDGDVWRDEIRTRFGGVVYMRAGSQLFTFDCLYTIQAERESIFNNQPEAIFGGDILMEGGSLTAVACSFFAIVPGFINSVSTEIGGSILILGGTATFTLVNFMTTQIFAWNIGVGMHIALLGGALNMAGCTHTANLIFAGQGLCGRNIFIGGGVGIFTGIAVTDTMALLGFFGAGLSIFIGGGLGVFTGCEITLINAISAKFGVGVGVAIGGGMGLFYGVPFAKNLGITQFNTNGVFVFVGAGRMAFIGCPFAHQNAIAAWELVGGAVYLGAGQAVIVGSPFARILGIDFFVGVGGDIAVLAGHLVYVGSAMTTDAGIGVFYGTGSEVFVAAGSAFIKGVSFSVNIGVHHYSEHLIGFYVMGRECEVKTEESEENAIFKAERGYGICSLKYGGEGGDGEIESHVVVQGLRGRQRFGGWRDDVEPLSTSPATLYIGPNVSSCALCGLEGVQVAGPGVEEGGACPAPGEEARACPEKAPSAPASAPPLAAAAVTASTSLTKTTALDSGFVTGSGSGSGKKGLFGFGGRLRRFLDGDSTEETSVPVAGEGESFVLSSQAGDEELPDTHVLVVDLAIWCNPQDGALGCPNSTVAVQHALEQTWLAGFEEGLEDTDGARVVVVSYKAPSALKATLGIPTLDAGEEEEVATDAHSGRALSSSTPSSCGTGGQELAFVAYAHTTDKATADALKARAKAVGAAALNATLAAAIAGTDGDGALCGVEASLRQAFFVPAPAKQKDGGAPLLDGPGGLDFTMLPRVWVNITAPIVEVGAAYDVSISHFDHGDRVGLHLVPSPPANSSAEPLFFQTAPRLLHTFWAFDAARGNATWMWEVSALLAKSLGPGPYYLKAFDTKEPSRFVLSQAFDIVAPGEAQQGSKRSRERRRAKADGHAVLRRLSSSARREGQEKVDDVAMMQAVLSSHKDKASTADFWAALLALPSAQEALGDAALAKALLAKAPVLASAPEVTALDEADGWKDATKVSSAMLAAIRSFADMALSTMRTSTTTSKPGMAPQNWPTRILESLTPEDAALAQQVARDGDEGALGQLLDNQAAKHFGGISMAQVKDPAMIDELKGLFARNAVLRELIEDRDMWTALGLDQFDASNGA